jgi:uncharacterized protein
MLMSDTLRDQLLQLGFKPAPKPAGERPAARPQGRGPAAAGEAGRGRREEARKPRGNDPRADRGAHPSPRDDAGRGARKHGARDGAPPRRDPPRRSQQEIDLGKAYALRARQEKEERMAAERERQEAARLRREARARLARYAADKALNDPAADIARHFEYGGKIKRIHVTAEQLRALNAGLLGVLQVDGRYLLVSAEALAEAAEIFADAVALRVDPDAPANEDPYADPRFQVPDDLVW